MSGLCGEIQRDYCELGITLKRTTAKRTSGTLLRHRNTPRGFQRTHDCTLQPVHLSVVCRRVNQNIFDVKLDSSIYSISHLVSRRERASCVH